MILSIGDVLNAAEVANAVSVLNKARFVDGRATAGFAARAVKSNAQARESEDIETLREMIADRLRANAVFEMAARPKRFIGPMFSRYRVNDAYGEHVDEPIMDGARTDISFTLFLSPPETYDGGELIIASPAGEDAVKLPAGSVIVYPSTTLHRVAPVTRGERLAAVGWVRSFIRDAAQRELLFELDTARRQLFEREGSSQTFNLVSKSLANLIRMWSED
ncbi:MAG: Fe2+-dependent dioxygenase [Proteobacteria bacterium]|nr:MAG: Fe2+-dependent dioxygenase [Pseudomonadota bacterium]